MEEYTKESAELLVKMMTQQRLELALDEHCKTLKAMLAKQPAAAFPSLLAIHHFTTTHNIEVKLVPLAPSKTSPPDMLKRIGVEIKEQDLLPVTALMSTVATLRRSDDLTKKMDVVIVNAMMMNRLQAARLFELKRQNGLIVGLTNKPMDGMKFDSMLLQKFYDGYTETIRARMN